MKKICLFIAVAFSVLSVKSQEKCSMKCDKSNEKKCEMMGKKEEHHNGEKKKVGEKREMIMKMLNLTEAQKNDLKKMHAEMKNKMDALEKEQTITVKEYNDRKTAIKKEMDSKRDQVLTKEQKDKIASMKANREKRKKEDFVAHLEKMKSNLSLTDEQIKKITALQEKTKSDIDKIKKDDQLNDQEKKIQIKKIMESAKESRLKIFTPEQTKKIEEMKKEKKNNHHK